MPLCVYKCRYYYIFDPLAIRCCAFPSFNCFSSHHFFSLHRIANSVGLRSTIHSELALDNDALPRVPSVLSNLDFFQRRTFGHSLLRHYILLYTSLSPYLTPTLDGHTAYKLDEGSIVDLSYQRIMTQNLEETPMPLGIQRSRSRLSEFLAADTLVAAGSATLITPAVMIFDR